MQLNVGAKISLALLFSALLSTVAGAQTVTLQGTIKGRAQCADDGKWPFETPLGCVKLAASKDTRCQIDIEYRGGEIRAARIFIPSANELRTKNGLLTLRSDVKANVMNTDTNTRSYSLTQKPHSVEIDFKLNKNFRPVTPTRFNAYLNHQFEQDGTNKKRTWIEYSCVGLKKRR